MIRNIMFFIGVICFMGVLSLLTGMVNQPWWFRFIYEFPMIFLIVHFSREYDRERNNKD